MSVPSETQVAPSKTWSSTCLTPECASAAFASTVTVPLTGPGSTIETVGFRLSTQRPVRAGVLLELPAKSVAITRRS